jgi:uncharacterized protein (TIGR02271 family)
MIQAGARVVDRDGLEGTLESVTETEEDGRRRAVILFAQGQRIRIPIELVTAQADGSYRLPFSVGAVPQGPGGSSDTQQTWIFPVMKEELAVERRVIDVAGVRVTKSVREEERVVDETLWRDEVGFDFVEVNRVVDGPIPVRSEGATLIVPILEEVLVVEKRLLLREELRLTRRRVKVRAEQTVTLRSEEISVDRVPLGQAAQGEEDQPGKPRAS